MKQENVSWNVFLSREVCSPGGQLSHGYHFKVEGVKP